VFVEAAATAPKIHKKNSHASATPVTDGERLYVHFGHMGTAALSLDGKQVLWKTNKLAYKPVHGNGARQFWWTTSSFSTPMAVIRSSSWRSTRDGQCRLEDRPQDDLFAGFSFATPLVVTENGKKLIVSPAAAWWGLRAGQGTEVWRVNYDGYSLIRGRYSATGWFMSRRATTPPPARDQARGQGRRDVVKHRLDGEKVCAPHAIGAVRQ